MLRLCATHIANLRDPCCDFARRMLRLCATHLATLRDPCCYFARRMLRLCAAHVATFRDPCCGFMRPMLPVCATHFASLRDPRCECALPILAMWPFCKTDQYCEFARLKLLAGLWISGPRKSNSVNQFGRNMSRGPRPGDTRSLVCI